MATLPLVREDTLPEASLEKGYYTDTGCHLRPACLSCDLPECYHDTTDKDRRQARDVLIVARHDGGASARKIAMEFDVTMRTVHRILQRGRVSDGL